VSGVENNIQRAIVGYVRSVAPECLIFAIPNAARRTAAGFAANGVPGLLPGIPDLCVLVPGGKAHFCEVKTSRTDLSDKQEAIRSRFISMDVPFAVVRSIEDMRAALAHWQIATKESV
jgi:hypothetical protein